MIKNFNCKLIKSGSSHAKADTYMWNRDIGSNENNYYLLHFPIAGSAEFIMDTGKKKLHPGKLYFISGWHIKRQVLPKGHFFDVSWLHFLPDSLELTFLLEQCPAFLEFPNKQFEYFYPFLKELVSLKLPPDQMYTIPNTLLCSIHSFLFLVIGEVLKHVGRKKSIENVQKLMESSKAIAYMDTHFHESPSLDRIAKVANLVPSYFHNKFKRNFGLTPFQYIQNLKINKAKQLLLQTSMRINEIAFQIGYKNAYHFSNSFKKVTGIRPKEFRKKADSF